ncbi:hypothetical protein RchiOBHm_Chr7g0187311 [Rosa chinensis]|uniref:Uncharacterized protein n=1 Tax=Rosa chinensis TaxID=74649 RepID=A0A2P6P472_ROSCH|nr:hypothetical protein RchiOBHm_Chr7g0187311 [Rosa chinensis]
MSRTTRKRKSWSIGSEVHSWKKRMRGRAFSNIFWGFAENGHIS